MIYHQLSAIDEKLVMFSEKELVVEKLFLNNFKLHHDGRGFYNNPSHYKTKRLNKGRGYWVKTSYGYRLQLGVSNLAVAMITIDDDVYVCNRHYFNSNCMFNYGKKVNNVREAMNEVNKAFKKSYNTVIE